MLPIQREQDEYVFTSQADCLEQPKIMYVFDLDDSAIEARFQSFYHKVSDTAPFAEKIHICQLPLQGEAKAVAVVMGKPLISSPMPFEMDSDLRQRRQDRVYCAAWFNPKIKEIYCREIGADWCPPPNNQPPYKEPPEEWLEMLLHLP